jgi:hypothetical protein
LVKLRGTGTAQAIDDCPGAVTSGGINYGLAVPDPDRAPMPAMFAYFGSATRLAPIIEPAGTATTRHRLALVCPTSSWDVMDCGYRMLTVPEIAAIQGVPEDAIPEGTVEDQVRLIGNMVPSAISEALAAQLLRAYHGHERQPDDPPWTNRAWIDQVRTTETTIAS